ncbi:hypothetical protein AB0H47_30880 [Streptomyces globisporus]|uniref:hypothetical protein n=1 Tax=Streptomyces TaxID=1883 RepID=UPI0015CF801A|nr:hypothetical protein [Streptomyces sp. st170]WSQ96546.1 hypothetical protein OG425_34660 [Streptomyces globisporus]
MNSTVRVPGRIGPRTLLITTAAVPLTGWAVHATALHKRFAATRRDPLAGLLRRDTYSTRARRLQARQGDSTTAVMVDDDHTRFSRRRSTPPCRSSTGAGPAAWGPRRGAIHMSAMAARSPAAARLPALTRTRTRTRTKIRLAWMAS